MTNDELNEKLSELRDDDSIAPIDLRGTGKIIPYYGWYWREVDFDSEIPLAKPGGRVGDDVPTWVGFCQTNKWGYPEFYATQDQSAEIKRLCIQLVEDVTADNALNLFNYLQLCSDEVSE